MSSDYDVVVVGNGPAGVAAALKAAARGARVGMVGVGPVGGACVNSACIPVQITLEVARSALAARELDAVGILPSGDPALRAGALAARRSAFIRQIVGGTTRVLRTSGVDYLPGHARFVGERRIAITGGEDSPDELTATSFVIATGSRWDVPAVPGLPQTRISTPDVGLSEGPLPASALVLCGDQRRATFAAEYAFLLATLGVAVTLIAEGELIPALDDELQAYASETLASVGVGVFTDASVVGSGTSGVHVRTPDSELDLQADLIIAPDCRRPAIDGLGLEALTLYDGGLATDARAATSVPGVFAAGDVTGSEMLTSAGRHAGEVAGENAAGGSARLRLDAVPRILHTRPEIGWVGRGERHARADGISVRAGTADLAWNSRAIVGGFSGGGVKIVTDDLGQIIGVHCVGPGAAEIVTVGSAFMQAQATVEDLASLVAWHPSATESLVDAARAAVH